MSLAPFLLYARERRLRAAPARVRTGVSMRSTRIISTRTASPPSGSGGRFDLPVVITARGSDVSQLPHYAVPRRLIRAALQAADGLVAVSASLGRAMLPLGAAPEKLTVLRNGVDTAMFRPLDREAGPPVPRPHPPDAALGRTADRAQGPSSHDRGHALAAGLRPADRGGGARAGAAGGAGPPARRR